MERPTNQLRDDHLVVSRGVDCLAAIAHNVAHGGPFPSSDVATTLRFLREWVVAVHMRMTDELMGPAVAMRGDHHAAEVVGQLFRLHEEITGLLHCLVVFWEPLGELTAEEQRGFSVAVDALVQRLEQRQQLETQVLFPACDRFVGADDQLDWLSEFEALEAERGSRAAWTSQIDAIASHWLD